MKVVRIALQEQMPIVMPVQITIWIYLAYVNQAVLIIQFSYHWLNVDVREIVNNVKEHQQLVWVVLIQVHICTEPNAMLNVLHQHILLEELAIIVQVDA